MALRIGPLSQTLGMGVRGSLARLEATSPPWKEDMSESRIGRRGPGAALFGSGPSSRVDDLVLHATCQPDAEPSFGPRLKAVQALEDFEERLLHDVLDLDEEPLAVIVSSSAPVSVNGMKTSPDWTPGGLRDRATGSHPVPNQ